jgi:hypothetical protein
MEQSPRGTDGCLASQEIPRHGSRMFIAAYTNARYRSVMCQMNPVRGPTLFP